MTKEILELLNERDYWEFGNNILYEMCAKYPKHDDETVALGKIWLIGRSYSASLERVKYDKSKKFYEDIVKSKIEKNSTKIDNAISTLSPASSLHEIFATYSMFLDVFNGITTKNNISFTSKYLHFHCPELFFIYDSRAKSVINDIFNLCTENRGIKKSKMNDFEKFRTPVKEYIRFYLKCQECVSVIEKETGKKISTRKFDNLLLAWKAQHRNINK